MDEDEENESTNEGEPIWDPNELYNIDTSDDDDDDLPGPSFIGGFGLDYIAGRPPLQVPGANPAFSSSVVGATKAFTATGEFVGTGYQSRYIKNDEYGLFANVSPQYVFNVQSDLIAAGYLDVDDVREFGKWGDSEAGAMKDIMEVANGSNRSWQNVLGGAKQSGMARRASGGGGGRIAPTIRLTNTDDLKATFRRVARQTTGGVFVDDSQLDAMVEAYHQKERAYQRSLVGGGGTAEAAPSAGTFAETSLEEMDPGAAQGSRFAQMTAVLGSLVS